MAASACRGEAGRAPEPRGHPRRRTLPEEILCFLGVNLLGDCLCTTPTITAFRRSRPDAFIAYVVQNAPHCRVLDGNPDIDLVIYNEDLAIRGSSAVSERWLRQLPIPLGTASELNRFDIQALHRSHTGVFHDHLSRGFARLFDVTIDSPRPIVAISDDERRLARSFVHHPYIVLGMHSTSPVVGSEHQLCSKDWVFERWLALARELVATGSFDIVAVGSESDSPTPSRYFRNLYGLPIKVVAALLQEAACVVTVESGLSHLCHAVDAPMVLIYSKNVPEKWAAPVEATRARVLYDYPAAIPADAVIGAVRSILASLPVPGHAKR